MTIFLFFFICFNVPPTKHGQVLISVLTDRFPFQKLKIKIGCVYNQNLGSDCFKYFFFSIFSLKILFEIEIVSFDYKKIKPESEP